MKKYILKPRTTTKKKFQERYNDKSIEDKKLVSKSLMKNRIFGDFPGGAVAKNLPANAGDTGSSPGPGKSHMPQSS